MAKKNSLNGKNLKMHFRRISSAGSLEWHLAQIFKSFWKPNPWMLLKKNLLDQFLLYFLQFKSFSPWMACFNSNINDLGKDKSNFVMIVANWGYSLSEKIE